MSHFNVSPIFTVIYLSHTLIYYEYVCKIYDDFNEEYIGNNDNTDEE